MKQLLRRLVLLVKRDKPVAVQPTGITTMDATEKVATHEDLVNSLLKNDQIQHEDVRNLSKTFFNVDLPSNLFRFKGGGPYGIVMQINDVHMVTNDDKKLDNILLHMHDTGMGTSLRVTVSVKDLNELFVPMFPKSIIFN